MRRCLAWVGALCLTVSAAVRADPLNLEPTKPDIFSSFITIDYKAATDAFSASGYALIYYAPSVYAISGGSFNLTAVIDEHGSASSGTLTIGGTIAALGKSAPLLTGDLAAFGYSPVAPLSHPQAPTFEFLFDITGGSLAPEFRRVGPLAGVILHGWSTSWTGGFASDYHNDNGSSDTFPTPEPGSACVMLMTGLLVAVGRRRRRIAAH